MALIAWMTKRNTLFAKIFLSFLTIIVLLSSFNFFSFNFFKSNVENNIIQYNQLILQNTAERYQAHIARIKTLLYDSYNYEQTVAFNRQLLSKGERPVDYLLLKDIVKDLQQKAFNPLYYLDNIAVLFRSDAYIVDKEGSTEGIYSPLFSNRMLPYSLSFWNRQFDEPGGFTIFPAAQSPGTFGTSVKPLIPVSYKTSGSNYQIIAFMDATLLLNDYLGEETSSTFFIVSNNGGIIYRSPGGNVPLLPEWQEGNDVLVKAGYYYFYRHDAVNQLTYVTAVPYAVVAGKIRRLSMTLLLALLLSVMIGIATSYVFSRRIQSPVKQLVSALLLRNSSELPGKIHEFSLIKQKINDLIRERDDIYEDLASKKSLLTSYGYIAKLKSINSDLNDWQEFIRADGTFRIVLYQLHFRGALAEEVSMTPDQAVRYLREYIDLVLSERFEASYTFQIENNQIVTILNNTAGSAMMDALRLMKTTFDRDARLLLVTIAVSPEFDHHSKFGDAYRQVSEMARQAKLMETTQIMTEPGGANTHFVFTPAQEHELYANLQAGNDTTCLQLICRMLDSMYKADATITQFRQYAEGIVAKVLKIMEVYRADISPELMQLAHEYGDCFTLEQVKRFFERFISQSAEAVRAKKHDQDHIVQFVLKYIGERYNEDLSLDAIADKLNMSSAYLSIYMKEKTGTNFTDHVNGIRIQRAKELLDGTGLNIHDIGVRIGYQNVTSFIRMFKKLTGLTPGEYRKSGTRV